MHTTKIKQCKANNHAKMKCQDRKNWIYFNLTKLIYRYSEGEAFKVLVIICSFINCIQTILISQKKEHYLWIPGLLPSFALQDWLIQRAWPKLSF